MKPLRPAVLGGIAVIVGVLCWAGARLWDSTGSLPGVPSAAPIVLAAIAVILTATAISFRARLRAQRDREPGARGVEPLVAARAVMFAQASVLVASVVAGIYGGLAVFLFTAADQSARRGQAVTALFAVLTAAAVIAAGIFLQRVCRLPEDEDGA